MKIIFLFILAILSFLPNPSAAADPVVVTVQKGENVRQIAARLLNDPDLWPDVLRANGYDSPHEIREGTVLKIPVASILTAHGKLTASEKMIQDATREGARVLAPDEIASAIDHRNQALAQREAGHWAQTIQLAATAEDDARIALEKSQKSRNLPAQAVLSQRKGRVNHRAPADTYWRDLSLGALMSEGEKVRTLSASFAEIRFRDDSRLRLNENAQIVIQKMREDRLKQRKAAQVSLVGGDIYALLKGSRNTNPFDVKVSGVSSSIRSNDFWVDRTGAEVRYANYDGEISVTAKGKQVVLKENQGTRVKKNQAPEAPRNLLPAPELASPQDFATIYHAPVSLKWTPNEKAAAYWLEIARDNKFGDMVVNETAIRQNGYSASLDNDGIYYWRVSAVDQDGFPGRKSRESFFKMQTDQTPPFLTITAPAIMDIFQEPEAVIKGQTERNAIVTVDGKPIEVGMNGNFSAKQALEPGENMVKIKARDPAGNIAQRLLSLVHIPDEAIPIQYDPDLPQISEKRFVANSTAFPLCGTARPGANMAVHPKGRPQVKLKTQADAMGRFAFNLPIQDPEATFELIASLPTGFSTQDEFVVIQDTTPPVIVVDDHPPAAIADSTLTLSGSVTGGIRLNLNSKSIPIDDAGRFRLTLELTIGENPVHLTAYDEAGNAGIWKKIVVLDQSPPELLGVQISKPQAKPGERVAIRVLASDKSGLKAAAFFVLLVGQTEHRGFLQKCPENACYQADFTVPNGSKGRISLKSVRLEDYLGNWKTYM